MTVHIFGIRHHGPGSARSLRRALEALRPDVVLVEGPPDADGVLPLLAHADMVPPVALLLYRPDAPRRAAFYPFAVFSPEWQAIDYALRAAIPVRFMDLPQAHQLAGDEPREEPPPGLVEEPDGALQRGQEPDAAQAGAPGQPGEEQQEGQAEAEQRVDQEELARLLTTSPRHDPLRWIAEAAGYSDGERWWDHMVEQRRDDSQLFEGILDLMSALRGELDEDPEPREQQREAYMRQTIRRAQAEGYQRIAVVCGAWHAPALAALPPPDADERLLGSLPRTDVVATWVPWTFQRLARDSGYGAGIESPGWYQHLWDHEEQVVVRWMAQVAAFLRAADLDASSAHVIEAVRLAEALAAVRGRPLPGLPELLDAVQAVLCMGAEAPIKLIWEQLIVGARLGQVPEDTPMLPLLQDLQRQQRRLRLAPEATQRVLELDLRKQLDLERSHLLHRLSLLGVPWGSTERVSGKKGTFHEQWRLQWQPDYAVGLVEANVWGTTILEAASAYVDDKARTDDLPQLTRLVEQALLADLATSIGQLVLRLEQVAALTSDIPHLMEALPPLAQVRRYGNVRQTSAASVGHVIDGLVPRICIGLPAACSALNDEAAEAMFKRLVATHAAVVLLQQDEHQAAWLRVLRKLVGQQGVHGLVAGRCCRLLLDQRAVDAEEVARIMGLAIAPAGDHAQAGAWLEGFLRGSALFLLHSDELWRLLDAWLASLAPDAFTQLLPLLRRTFATFPGPERRQLGARARDGGGRAARAAGDSPPLDERRANLVLPVVARLLGLDGNVG